MSDLIQKRARRRRIVTRAVIGVVLLAIVGFVAMRFAGSDPAPSYRTATVTRGDIESAIVALGTVEPKNYVDVGAQVSGQLLRLHYDVGDQVQQGELVAEIDPQLAQSRVDADQAQLRELQASHRQQTAQLALARAAAKRSQALLTADAISQAEWEADDAQLQVAEAQLAQLEAQIDRTQSTLEGDLTSLNYTKIYAPMTGTVISHSAVEGQTLNANQTAPVIMRIADLTVMTVSADVSEADVPRLREGLPAYFTTLGDPDRRWRATVRQILPEPEVVNDVVLYKALLDVQNEDRALLPQMSAQVSFVLGQARNVLRVPAAALQIPASMIIAAGGQPVADAGAAAMGPGDGGGPGGFQPSEEMRQRIANMSDEERAQMRARFQQGGGVPGGAEGGEDGPAARFAQGGSDQPDWMSDGRGGPKAHVVLVLTPNGPSPRTIQVGLVSRTEAEVISGLEQGEEIVLGMAAASAGDSGGFRGPPGGFRPF